MTGFAAPVPFGQLHHQDLFPRKPVSAAKRRSHSRLFKRLCRGPPFNSCVTSWFLN